MDMKFAASHPQTKGVSPSINYRFSEGPWNASPSSIPIVILGVEKHCQIWRFLQWLRIVKGRDNSGCSSLFSSPSNPNFLHSFSAWQRVCFYVTLRNVLKKMPWEFEMRLMADPKIEKIPFVLPVSNPKWNRFIDCCAWQNCRVAGKTKNCEGCSAPDCAPCGKLKELRTLGLVSWNEVMEIWENEMRPSTR